MEIDEYTITKLIGRGAFGDVYLGSKKRSRTKYAFKKKNKAKYLKNPKASKYLENEISILKDINHPNIIKIYDVKETLKDVYIITEYCNKGPLDNFLYKNKNLTEEIAQYMMNQVIEAFKYLHNKKIMHRNINLDNILIDYEDLNDKDNNNIVKGKIKIIDFGFARFLKKGELSKSILGSPLYMSPLLLSKLNKLKDYEDSGYDEKEDIWSLGIICYELLVGKNPFHSNSMKDLLDKMNKWYYFVPTTLSKESISFLNCMLQFNSKKRLSLDKLYKHKFLRKNVNEFNKIDIDELKNITILENSKILISAKDNQNIYDNFGAGIEESI